MLYNIGNLGLVWFSVGVRPRGEISVRELGMSEFKELRITLREGV